MMLIADYYKIFSLDLIVTFSEQINYADLDL